MKCLSVLDNEMKVCDSIIQFKKDNKKADILIGVRFCFGAAGGT